LLAVIFFQPIIDQVLYHISNRCALFCTRSFEADMYPRPPFEYHRGQFGYRKLLYYKDFPGMSKPVFMGSSQKTESMVTPVFATPILTTSWLA
ncbi:hypothetical protein ACVZZA_004559, partial [Yersinia enterocolitica]